MEHIWTEGVDEFLAKTIVIVDEELNKAATLSNSSDPNHFTRLFGLQNIKSQIERTKKDLAILATSDSDVYSKMVDTVKQLRNDIELTDGDFTMARGRITSYLDNLITVLDKDYKPKWANVFRDGRRFVD